MRLSDLVDQTELRLTMLTGGQSLDRPVRQVYTTDLLDPGRYLSGGELVLTGLMWRRRPADSERFAAAVARAGVSAVGAGEAAFGCVPPDLVDACDRHGVALLGVPVEVSFQTISDRVGAVLRAEHATGLVDVVGRHHGLIAATAEGAELADLLPAAAADAGLSCWALSATGRLVAGTSPLAEELRTRLARSFLSAPRLPHVERVGKARYSLFSAGTQPGSRLPAWFLACDGDPAAWPDGQRRSVDGLITLLTLERAHVDRALHAERRLAGQLLQPLCAGGADPAEVRARLQSCRLAPDGTYVALTATLVTESPTAAPPAVAAELAAAVVEEIVRPCAQRAAIAVVGDEVQAVVPVAPADVDALLGQVRQAARTLEAGIGPLRMAIGVSDPATSAAELARAVEAARHAHRYAASGPERVLVVSSTELSSHVLLLAGLPAEARRSFHTRLLGPLTEYDRAHGAELVRTLDTFLSCDGSWTRSAEILHVHVNTLRYRIQRIEQLTGRALDRFDDRVDFYLALQLRRR